MSLSAALNAQNVTSVVCLRTGTNLNSGDPPEHFQDEMACFGVVFVAFALRIERTIPNKNCANEEM